MKFLLDQNADRRFAAYLRGLGHDVTVVAIDYPPGIPDHEVLATALGEGRIVITNDRDFGELVVRAGRPHVGVIYLRLYTPDFAAKRARLDAVLADYADQLDGFLTVTADNIRIRRAGSA